MLTKADIEQYFLVEKNAAFFFLIAGIAGILIGIIFLLALKTSFYKGAAIVLIVIGLLQLMVGYSIYSQADKLRVDTVYAYDLNPGKLKNIELPRISKAVTGIQVFIAIEALFILAGIITYFKNKPVPGRELWVGIALTLIIEAVFILAFDVLALKRNKTYKTQLQQFIQR